MDLVEKIEKALEAYELIEIFELNDMTVEQILLVLVQKGIIVLPEMLPL